MSTRSQVLSLYRNILRTARTWQGGQQEQEYIRQEAQTLFRAHKDLQDPEEIEAKIKEAEDRLEIAVHYQIPYPRMYHAPQFRKRQYLDVPIIRELSEAAVGLRQRPTPADCKAGCVLRLQGLQSAGGRPWGAVAHNTVQLLVTSGDQRTFKPAGVAGRPEVRDILAWSPRHGVI